MPVVRLALAAVVAFAAASASAEIYRWTDEDGRVHFTQSLGQVPPRHRRQAEEEAGRKASGASKVQTYSSGTPRPAAPAPTGRLAGPDEEVHRIRVSRAGTGMLVQVRLDNAVTAPFLIDTGASDVLVPETVARQLGLEIGPGVRTKRYSTANGVVEHPVVTLRSVDLGGAVVKDVPASVSPSMKVGLLGLSFFNHFTYNIDAAAGVVTLRRNRLAASGEIRGGRSAAQWRAEFAGLRGRLGAIDREFEHKAESKSRERRRLERARAEVERQLELLTTEADSARVPMAWRQ